jgi:hypothetical protein
VGNALLSRGGQSRLAPASALLLGIVWIAEMVRIFHPAPALATLAATCLAAYVAMALARSSAHIRMLFLLAAGVSVAIAAWLGSTAALVAGFTKAQVFGAFLPSVLLLRATVEASPRIGALRADLGGLGHEAAQNWTQYGSHALGAVLNVGATAILAPVVARGAAPERLPDLARSSARGVGGAVLWSPFFLAMAFTSQLVPQAPMWQSMLVGLGLAAIGLALSYALFTPGLGAAGFRASLARLGPLALPMLLVIGAVVGATLAFGLSGLQSVAIVVPLLCLGYVARLGPSGAGGVVRRTVSSFARLADELLIVVGATLLGAAIAALPFVRALGSSMTPDMISGPALLAALVVVLLVLGQAGLHPMIGSSIVVPVVAAGGFGLCGVVIVSAGVFAWALNASVSIWTLPVAVAASSFGVPAAQMLSRRTLQFAALHALAGIAFLWAANAVLTRLGCP